MLGIAGGLLIAGAAYAAGPALPTGGQFVAGAGAISAAAAANGMVINQSTARGIIDWRTFNIGAGGSVVVNNGSGATLNRVVGGQASQINGSLSATGSVYLVNPQGVVVGPSGKVIAGGNVVLTTRDIDNGAFMAGGAMTASGSSTGDVTNAGKIIAKQGDVVMIGRSVNNTGSISAKNGEADLAAANVVLLSPSNGSGIYVAADTSASGSVTEEGRIKAAAASLQAAGGNVYTLAGNHSDLIEATGTTTVAGKVWLSAPNGDVSVAGTIKAQNVDGSGGQIVVHGGRSTALSGTLDASGLNGGLVLVGVSAPQTDLSTATTIADGAVIRTGGAKGAGQVETSGHTLTLGNAQVTTAGGGWLLDPTDLTINTAAATSIVSALGSSDVTIVTNNGVTATGTGLSNSLGAQAAGNGDINVASAITWSTAHSLTLNAQNNLNINAGVNGGATGGFTGIAGGAISVVAAVEASTVSLQAKGGNVTLAAAGKITSHAAGVGIALSASGNFVNNAGATALVTNGGNWRVFSTNPNSDTLGGLAPDYYQYNAVLGATALGTGNGAFYSVAPSVTYALMKTGGTQAVTKVYDGTNAATTFSDAQNLSATGLLTGDAIGHTGAATYSQTFGAGADLLISIGGVQFTRAGKPVFGYTATGQNQGVIGAITPAPITVGVAAGPTKTYDGSVQTSLASTAFTITPGGATPIAGQSITVGQPSSINFDAAGAGTTGYTVIFASSSFTAGAGTDLNNYNLQPGAAFHFTNGLINPQPVTVKNLVAVNKVYDGTATISLNSSQVSLSGLANPGDATLDGSTLLTALAANGGAAGTGVSVTTAVAFQHTGNWQDYTIVQPALTVNITPLTITLAGLNSSGFSRAYDGTTTITSAQLAGFGTAILPTATSTVVQTDVANGKLTLSTAGGAAHFATKDAATGIAILLSGYTLGGANNGDYTLAFPSLTGAITPAQLLAAWVNPAPTKVYNGNTGQSVTAANYSITGFAAGEGASLIQFSDVAWSQANAGSANLTTKFALTDFAANAGVSLQNYKLPANLVVAGTITPAPLSIAIVGNPTKTQDGNANATLTSANFTISGFVGGESATVAQTAGTYASANPGTQSVSAVINTGVLSPGAGTLLSNYSFASTATGVGTILASSGGPGVTISVTGSKLYDATNSGTFGAAGSSYTFVFNNLTAGETNVALDTSKITSITYGGVDAGQYGLTVNIANSQTSFTGADAHDYTLPYVATGIGTILQRQITLTLASKTKVYNGTNIANLTGADVSFGGDGVVAGQTLSVAQISGVYNTSEVTTANTITANVQLPDLVFGGGAKQSNYNFTNLGALTAVNSFITPAPVVIQNVSANSKVYDTTNAATLTSGASTFGIIAADTSSVGLAYPTGAVTFAGVDVGTLAINGLNGATGFTLTGAKSSDYALQPVSLTAAITPKAINMTGITVPDMVYNNTTQGTINGTATITAGAASATDGKFYTGDAVSVSGSGTATFAQKDVRNGISVAIGSFTLSGAKAANYTLTVPTLTANITPRPLNVTLNEVDKVYDGAVTGYVNSGNFSVTNFAQGEGPNQINVVQAYTAAYNSKDVATANLLTATLKAPDYLTTLPDLSNYTLPTSVSAVSHITPAPLTAAIVGNPTKVYDGHTTANLTTANVQLMGFVNSSEGGSYSSLGTTGAQYYLTAASPTGTSNVGVITIKTDGVTLGTATFAPGAGTLSSNYTLPTIAIGAGTITPLAITISGAQAQNKVYNQNTNAVITGGTLVGLVTGDSVQIVQGNGTFASKDVANGIAVTAKGFGLTGAQAGNYTVSQPTGLSANITPVNLVIQVTKVYDGTTTLPTSGTAYSLLGVLGGDTVTLNSTAIAGSYNSPHVNDNTSASPGVFTLTGGTLAGAQGGDYNVTYTNNTHGIITPLALTVTGAAGIDKNYDGTTAATISNTNTALSPRVAGETQTITLTSGGNPINPAVNSTGTFANANVAYDAGGHVIAVAISTTAYGLSGNTHGDYSLTQPNTLSAKINPAVVTVVPTGVTKVYDGTNVLPTANIAYSLGNVLAADSGQVLVNGALVTGSYDGIAGLFDVGTGLGVHLATLSLTGSKAGDYTIAPTFAGNIGTITKANLTALINPQTKVYDGNANTVTSLLGQYTITGVHGEKATINIANGVYNSLHTTATTVTVNGVTAANFSDAGSPSTVFKTSNYNLPTSITGTGTITAKPVTVLQVTKTYDGGATLTQANSAILFDTSAAVAGDTLTLNFAGLSGATYSGVHANNTAVTVSTGTTPASGGYNVTLPGLVFTNSDYKLSIPNGIGLIKPVVITYTLTDGKTYDGTNTATVTQSNFIFTGFVGSQGVTLSLSGTYNSANASTNPANPATSVSVPVVLANYAAANAGTTLSDYVLPTGTLTGTGSITAKQINLLEVNKVFDGANTITGGAGGNSNFFIDTSAIVAGDTAALDFTHLTNATYSGFHANDSSATAHTGSTAAKNGYTVTVTGLQLNNANYALNTSGNIGIITAKPITLTAVTKIYDGGNTLTGANSTFTLDQTQVVPGASNAVTVSPGYTGGAYAGSTVLGGPYTVSVPGLTLSNPDYKFQAPTAAIGTITVKTINLLEVSKVYDGSNSLTTSSTFTIDLAAIVAGDTVGLDFSGMAGATYLDLHANSATAVAANGSNKATGGYTVTVGGLGLNNSNYKLDTTGSIGIISPKPVNLLQVTKTYDGDNTLTQSNSTILFDTNAAVAGDTLTLNFTGLSGATYSGPHANNTAVTIANGSTAATGGYTVALPGLTFTDGDYAINPASLTGIGLINPKPITYVLTATKPYDGTNAAPITEGNFTFTGFVGAQGVTLSLPGTYNSANASTNPTNPAVSVSVPVLLTDYFVKSGTTLSDYTLPTGVLTGTGTITAKTINLLEVNKVFDGSSALTSTNSNFFFDTSAVVGGDTVALDASGLAGGLYVGPNAPHANGGAATAHLGSTPAQNGYTVTVTGLALNNANYSLNTSGNIGIITAKPITLTGVTKVYDGGNTLTGANSTFTLDQSAIVGSSPVNVQAVGYTGGTYAGSTVAGGPYTVSVPGLTLTSTDYQLMAPTAAIGTITPKTVNLLEVAKTYDGTNALTSANSTFTIDLAAIVAGDTVGLDVSGMAGTTYGGVNANKASVIEALGSAFATGGYNVSVTGLALNNSNYVLSTTQPAIGLINPKAITVTLAAQTKQYDSTLTAAGLTPGSYTLTGFVGTDGATIGQTVGAYNTKDVLTAVSVTAQLLGQYTATGGANFGNYVLPTSVTGLGAITPAPLSVSGLSVMNKVYDGTTAATLSNVGAATLTGVFAGDNVVLSTLPGGANFTTPNVGNAISVMLAGAAISGTDVGDYVLLPTALPTANITPRPLTAVIVGNPTKTYDGTTVANLGPANFQLGNLVPGETLTVNQTVGTYADPNAGTKPVSAVLPAGVFANGLGLASNYILPTSAVGPGTITPAPLTVSIIGDPTKPYDGNTNATLGPNNFQIGGFVGGDGAGIGVTTGLYANAGPGSETVTAQLTTGDFNALGPTRLGNYLLPPNATGPGLITGQGPAAAIPANADLFTRFEAALVAKQGRFQLTKAQIRLIRQIQFDMATPRIYIPFPAPGALSTWKGNGFGSLPIVVDQTTDYNSVANEDGVATQSGAPVLNNTEQILMQGVRSKQYRIILPLQTDGELASR